MRLMKSRSSKSKRIANSVTEYQSKKSRISKVSNSADFSFPHQSFQEQVVALVNVERKRPDIAPLMINLNLSKVANLKAADMRDNNYFSHYSPQYGTPFEMLKNFGGSYQYAAENIAAGYITPQAAFEGWKNSPSHYASMLNANYKYTGIGYVLGLESNRYKAYWVQLFKG